jgi:hypothetical protein
MGNQSIPAGVQDCRIKLRSTKLWEGGPDAGSLEPVFEFFENWHFYVSKNLELKF